MVSPYLFEQIRILKSQGLSQAAIARKIGLNEKTVGKYIKSNSPPKYKAREKSTRVDEFVGFEDRVLSWLKKTPTLTAIEVYELLLPEGYKGSERTVNRRLKKLLPPKSEERFFEQEYEPGEQAQFDFKEKVELPFVDGNKIIHLHFSTLPFSDTCFIKAFPNKNYECFIDGVDSFFHEIGGVPKNIRFDNLTPCVKKILNVRKPKDLKVIRPRLSADELEEKVFAELEIALKTQGYFDELAAILAKQSEVNNKGNAAEFQRVQQELKDVNLRISAIWTNQSRMQLSEEALKLASDELNRLAIQKQDLEKYQRQLGEHRSSPEIFREKANFIEAQVKWCLQGWVKAPAPVKKRLLRRTIKEIIVTQTELCITFWTSSEERDYAIGFESVNDSNESGNLVAFRRRSPRAQDQNLSVISSGNVRNGRGCVT